MGLIAALINTARTMEQWNSKYLMSTDMKITMDINELGSLEAN